MRKIICAKIEQKWNLVLRNILKVWNLMYFEKTILIECFSKSLQNKSDKLWNVETRK